MDINHIKYILTIYELGNITKAANKLFVSQQALSSTLKQVEKSIGEQLFIRVPSGMKPTEAGDFFYELFNPIVTEFEIAMGRFSKKPDSESITLALAPGLLRSLGLNLLFGFSDAYPEISLKVIHCLDSECADLVREKKADIALCPAPTNMKGLKFDLLSTEPLCAIMSKDNPFATKQSLSISDIRNFSLISLDDKHAIYHTTVSACKRHGFTPEIAHFSTEVGYLCSLALHTDYIFICIRHITEDLNDSYVTIPFHSDEMVWKLGFVWPKDTELKTPSLKFMDFIKQNMNNSFSYETRY